jgi:hypothetical protein
MTLAIDISGLTYRFGEHVAVDDLSLEVEPGERFGLLGPNGAGKTTTIRLLNTLLPLRSGEVTIFGRSVRRDAMAVRRLIGYVPQQLSIEGNLTGGMVLAPRIATFCLVELQKLRHDRSELVTRAIQPILWLVIFGTTFSQIRAIPTGGLDYLDFLAPGVIAQSALFISIFYGIQIIWERDSGVLTKLLVTPTPRSALVAGKAFAAGVRFISHVNPRTYEVAALRGLLLDLPTNYWLDFGVLAGSAVAGILCAAALIGRLAR